MNTSTSLEKAEITEAEIASHGTGKHSLGRDGKIGRIDAMADAPGVTMATFAHLDEKKILRKVRR